MWRLTPGQLLRHRQWDEECVLYNDLSGDTHLLGLDALAILMTLRDGAADEAALAAALDWGDPDAALGALLSDLLGLSLIEQRPC